MALFSRTKKTTEAAPVVAGTKARPIDRDLSRVIIAPVVSEKAVMQQGRQVYVFFVSKDATKFLVRDAIRALYKVTPVQVNIVNKRPKSVLSRARGREVKQAGFKKAYVYLKAGDTINIA